MKPLLPRPELRPADVPADAQHRADLLELMLRLADDRLVLGHRLSEWCGHAPLLEEELALGNVALDLLGQATGLLELAADLENRGRSADALAFWRDLGEFRCCLLVEQPNGDFAHSIARQLLFDAADTALLPLLERSRFAPLAAIAAKASKEATYHLRHSRAWLLRLGDGTEESRRRVRDALDALWPFADELLADDDLLRRLVEAGLLPDLAPARERFARTVAEALAEATLAAPEPASPAIAGGRRGLHGEHLGRLLDEMQVLARAHPGAGW